MHKYCTKPTKSFSATSTTYEVFEEDLDTSTRLYDSVGDELHRIPNKTRIGFIK